MMKLDSKGITDYYNQLPFGSKDAFVVAISNAIDKSTQSVRRKIRLVNWNKLELPIVYEIIDKKAY